MAFYLRQARNALFCAVLLVAFPLTSCKPVAAPEADTAPSSHIVSLSNDLSQQHPLGSGAGASDTQTSYWLDQMDHTGAARGYAPFVDGDSNYQVYRNVKLFGAAGDGATDDAHAIQAAIDFDDQGRDRTTRTTLTTRPAEVFLPGGTYVISTTIYLRLNTILIGDPSDPPVIQASSGFSGWNVIDADVVLGTEEQNFFMAVKNIAIDTTQYGSTKTVSALKWPIAQACHLTNLDIRMPTGPSSHTGIDLSQLPQWHSGSATTLSDVTITGGQTGIACANQQINIKNVSFKYCSKGIDFTGGFSHVVQGANFEQCGRCIDISGAGSLGSVVILDCTAVDSGAVVTFFDSSQAQGPRNDQIVIDNLHHSGDNAVACTTDQQPKLTSIGPGQTWVWGNVVPGQFQQGSFLSTPRTPGLVNANGHFFTMKQPAYANYSGTDVVNVKGVDGFSVKGDGRTDDSASLNAILAQAAAAGKVAYVPYGIYVLESTLYVPPGTVSLLLSVALAVVYSPIAYSYASSILS